MEAVCLGFFMISACGFTVLLFHPSSAISQRIESEILRRALMGLAMGSTAIAIIFSPLGKRSGAHINPAVTLTYLRLGKVKPCDAAFYTLFQFLGAILGVVVAGKLMGELLAHQLVNYAVTVPGPKGWFDAFLAEIVISFLLMTVILMTSNNKRLARWTGLFAGLLIATYITLESPISGMSMNPARTLGSATGAQVWTDLWIYFTAPPIGMLSGAEVYKRIGAGRGVACAKLHHLNNQRCIFECNFKKQSQISDGELRISAANGLRAAKLNPFIHPKSGIRNPDSELL
jgi:aquaporin Z